MAAAKEKQEPANDNLMIWDKVCVTPPGVTRPFYTASGKRLSDVNPQWRIETLTKLFGPAGMGWGFDIVERWRESWKNSECCYIRGHIWYIVNESRYETPDQIGGTSVEYSPDECWKMSITDALGKCAASLGVAADIYLGTFDTSKYRDQASPESKPESPPQQSFGSPSAPKTARDFIAKPPAASSAPRVAVASESMIPF